MSESAGMARSLAGVREALEAARRQWRGICENGLRQDGAGYLAAMEVREMALAQLAFLEAIRALLERGSGSRGSHLVLDPSGTLPHPDLSDEWRFLPENAALRQEILEIGYDAATGGFVTHIAPPRPMPTGEFWFENTWAEFREGRIYGRGQTDRTRPYNARP